MKPPRKVYRQVCGPGGRRGADDNITQSENRRRHTRRLPLGIYICCIKIHKLYECASKYYIIVHARQRRRSYSYYYRCISSYVYRRAGHISAVRCVRLPSRPFTPMFDNIYVRLHNIIFVLTPVRGPRIAVPSSSP